MTEQGVKKCKMKIDHFNQGGKMITLGMIIMELQCVICMQVLSVPKECNLKRHCTFLHEDKLKK
jgi:hypothetical protein